jgi:hypothetical protein
MCYPMWPISYVVQIFFTTIGTVENIGFHIVLATIWNAFFNWQMDIRHVPVIVKLKLAMADGLNVLKRYWQSSFNYSMV